MGNRITDTPNHQTHSKTENGFVESVRFHVANIGKISQKERRFSLILGLE